MSDVKDGRGLGKLSDAVKKANPAGDDESFPTELSADEAEFGFYVTEIDNPGGGYAFASPKIRVALVEVVEGLFAIKMALNGDTSYAIWNTKHRPVQDSAWSVVELRRRFPR